MRPAWFAVAILALSAGCASRPDPLPGFPRLMLWAWERPEDLRFLDARTAGVAFLARTVSWRDGVVDSRARMQPLRVPPNTSLMAVVRLESNGGPLPEPASVARETARAALPGVRALQVDFDARLSERAWYREFLERLRAGLPAALPLGMTALTSWCEGDSWTRGLPVVDAVPMLFRLGPGEGFAGGDFRNEMCRSSVGVSTDELPRAIPRGRRLFVFHPRPWTEETYRGAAQLARKWRCDSYGWF
jgi:hypothetical protein